MLPSMYHLSLFTLLLLQRPSALDQIARLHFGPLYVGVIRGVGRAHVDVHQHRGPGGQSTRRTFSQEGNVEHVGSASSKHWQAGGDGIVNDLPALVVHVVGGNQGGSSDGESRGRPVKSRGRRRTLRGGSPVHVVDAGHRPAAGEGEVRGAQIGRFGECDVNSLRGPAFAYACQSQKQGNDDLRCADRLKRKGDEGVINGRLRISRRIFGGKTGFKELSFDQPLAKGQTGDDIPVCGRPGRYCHV